MRKLFWRLHSFIGLAAGLGLVVIGISGSLLVFHEEISALLQPEQTRVEPTSGGRLSFEELVLAVESQLPEYAVTGWDFNHDNERAADGAFVIPFGVREWQYITVDPYRGTVLSGPLHHDLTFKGLLLELHYTFFADHWGMAISGLLGIALCFLGLSGLWLYRRFWKTLFRLRWRASARMLLGDFHRLVGVTSVAFNLLLGFTGAYWNVAHVIDEFAHEPHPDDVYVITERLLPDDLPLNEILADAPGRLPGFRTHYVSLPWAPDGAVTLWGDFDDGAWFRSPHGSQMTYASQDGSFVSLHDIRGDSWWSQTLDAFEPLHFGSFGGLPIKLLWALAGLAPGLLAISGTAIWWKRRRRRKNPPRSASGKQHNPETLTKAKPGMAEQSQVQPTRT